MLCYHQKGREYDPCACRYKVDNLTKILCEVLMMTTIAEVGGNNLQLSDDDNLTRESSQASLRKETQD